ncbi:hypothetical protein O3G_MSEX001576 [Manduca sexta]|uniref:Uncharacterized protein n=1 Tax=Manduca sexta TaxID=7130 RepID=A0A921YKI0_MANSE|nr:hypothetical protein O3G_MSEX001576 [Manduca sexta]
MLSTISRLLLAQGSYARQSLRFLYHGTPATVGKYATEQFTYIKSAIENNQIDWEDIKNNLLSIQGGINQKNVDAVLFKFMIYNKKYDAARSFGQHLKSSNNEVSLGSLNGLLSLYYELGKENNLSKEEKLDILNIYNYLHDKYKVLDFLTCEHLLHALCVINEWSKAIKLLDDINLSSKPSHSAYSIVIATLFRNNKKKMAMEFIQKSVNNKRGLQDIAYDAWIDYILRKYKQNDTKAKYLNEIVGSAYPVNKT